MVAHFSRAQALALVVLIWSGIYLPALGTLEIKGEEGHRILPGVTMLETGNWIVPSVGGVDYFSKPPLINWAIAGAIRASGRQNEWAARAPSVLCVLALGLCTVWLLTDWLGAGGALLAAIFMLTGIGLMEKGRLAEIEAMYISLYGLAMVSWLSLWRRTRLSADESRGQSAGWLAWTVPWMFLGLGLLTKGPMLLVFFYAVAIGILLASGRLREFWSWPHLAGVVLMLAIFAAWLVPYLHLTAGERVGRVWSNQMANRFEIDEGFRPGMWALNIPRGLANFVPWVVLLPLWWRRRRNVPATGPGAEVDLAILRGGRGAVAVCFLVVSVVPGSLPRYTLPLLVPAAVLLALVCTRADVFGALPNWLPAVWARTLHLLLSAAAAGAGVAAWTAGGGWRWAVAAAVWAACAWLIVRTWRMPGTSLRAVPSLAVISGVLMAILTLDYAVGAVPRLLAKERMRPLATRINQAVADAAPLYAYQPGFLPILFYLHPSARYSQRVADLPASAEYLLVYEKDYPLVAKQLHAGGYLLEPAMTLGHLSRGTWYLVQREKAR